MSAPLVEELRERLERAEQEAQTRRYVALGRDAVLWLALVPEWSDELARACQFPCDGEIDEWIQRARDAGMCELRRSTWRQGRRTTSFAMPASVRQVVVRDTENVSRSELRDLAAAIGDRISRSMRVMTVPRAVGHWADLARASEDGSRGAGEFLNRRIADAAQADAADALDWIAAGEVLAPILGSEVQWAVSRGTRRVNLAYRRRLDERLLERFVPRTDAIAALREVVLGQGSPWALHLIGMGGAGKTMLLRYLATGLARDGDEPPFPVGRVDFDHIDPRFPWQRPAQLLIELADALGAYIETPLQQRNLDRFIEAVRAADDSPSAGAPEMRVAALWTDEFRRAVAMFASFLAVLPHPVVLVLDTCEELAKLHSGHTAKGTVPSVDAMFSILEHLRDELERLVESGSPLRVVLAGRRLLAVAGDGWSYDDATPQPPALTSLKARSYLRLYEVRGFDATEASALLSKATTPERDVVDAILSQSLETGRVPGVPGGQGGTADDRFNPFDLSLYADWLRERPDLRPEEIASGETDAYVEARIIERIHDDNVLAALPAAVLLGRFDLSTIEPALRGDEHERRRIVQVLAEQEWIDLAAGDHQGEMVLAVERNLLRRLQAFYERPERRSELDDAGRSLGPHLVRVLAEAPWTALAIDRADAALRILGDDERETFWMGLELRVAREAAWEWAAEACLRLLGDDEWTGQLRHPRMRAPIAATRLAAMLHREAVLRRDAVSAADWDEVLRRTENERHGPELDRWLTTRAELGRVSAGAAPTPELIEGVGRALGDRLEGFDGDHREHAAAAALAAIDTLLESEVFDPVHEFGVDFIRDWVLDIDKSPMSAAVKIAAWTQLGRIQVASGRPDVAAREFSRAARIANTQHVTVTQRWLDWSPPDAPLERTRLEWLLGAPDAHTTDMRGVWIKQAARRVADSTDAERLVSAVIVDWLRYEPVPEAVVSSVRTAALIHTPRCQAHRSTPPLFVAVARAMVALGQVEAAIDLLQQVEESATAGRGRQADLRDAAAAARLELVRALHRMRLARIGTGGALLDRLAYGASEVEEVAAARVAEVLVGIPIRKRLVEESPHVAWRAHVASASDSGLSTRVLRAARITPSGHRAEDAILSPDLLLDAIEAQLLEPSQPPAAITELEAALAEALADGRLQAATTIATLRVKLRAFALGCVPEPECPPARRAAGEAALLEGELLALRLPDRATVLLDFALTRFEESDDRIGAFMAATLGALAAFRTGPSADGQTRVRDRVEPAFERLSELVRAQGRDVRADPQWEGWRMRHLACRQWAAGEVAQSADRVPAELVPPAYDLLPPSVPVGTAEPPVEPASKVPDREQSLDLSDADYLDVFLRHPTPSPAHDRSPRRNLERELDPRSSRRELERELGLLAPRPARRRLRTLGRVFATTAVVLVNRVSTRRLAAGAAILVVAAFLLLNPLGGTEPRTILGYVVGLAAVGTALALAIGSRATAGYCEIWEVPGRVGGGRAARATLTTFIRLPGPGRALRVKAVSERIHIETRGWSHAPPGAIKSRLSRRFARRVGRVALRIEPSLATLAWERRLLPSRGGPGVQAPPRIYAWRSPHGERPARTDAPTRRSGPFVAAGSDAWQLFLEDGTKSAPVRAVISSVRLWTGAIGTAPPRILLVLGRGVRTPGGWRLHLDDDAAGAQNIRMASDDSQVLLAPERLVSHEAALVILQGFPGEPDAEAAGGLRAYADALLAIGAAAVLVVPALPSALASEIMRKCVRELRSGHPRRRDLLRLTRKVRAIAFRGMSSDVSTYDVALDTALDVCLYLSDEVK